jgi:hypothetical protein
MDAGLHEREMTFDDLAAEKVPCKLKLCPSGSLY